MERENINELEKWDLSLIYKTSEEFYKDLEYVKTLLQQLLNKRDSFIHDLDVFIDFLNEYVELSRYLNKLYCFAHLHCDVEPNNQEYQTMNASILSFYNQVSVSLDFYSVTLIENSETVLKYLEDERLKEYRYSIKEILRQKKHTLSLNEETLISKTQAMSDVASQVFDALRLDYDDVIIDGKKHTLNSATLTEFLKNKDQKVRKNAYENFFKEYKKFENVFAATLSGVMHKDAFYADVRHFETPLHASLFDDNVPTSLFEIILDKANKQYRPLFHRYNELKKKIMNLEETYNYDLSGEIMTITLDTLINLGYMRNI